MVGQRSIYVVIMNNNYGSLDALSFIHMYKVQIIRLQIYGIRGLTLVVQRNSNPLFFFFFFDDSFRLLISLYMTLIMDLYWSSKDHGINGPAGVEREQWSLININLTRGFALLRSRI